MLFSDLKVQAGLMTETEMKRIEFMMRVMSSHQVFFYLVTIYGYHTYDAGGAGAMHRNGDGGEGLQ